MAQFDVAEAKARFSELIDEAARGSTIVIAKSGTPVAKIVPIAAERADSDGSRTGIPTRCRTPFRGEAGHCSEVKPDSIPR